jgi:hypothetical protein
MGGLLGEDGGAVIYVLPVIGALAVLALLVLVFCAVVMSGMADDWMEEDQ